VTNPVISYIALGANLGDAVMAVRQAMLSISALESTTLLRSSSLYRTAPVDSTGPDYINAVVEINTGLSPMALLDALQQIEQTAGRERLYFNAPRTLDLDILLYGDVHVDSPTLVIPHPRMLLRAFVLVPLAEIAGDRVSVTQLQLVSHQAITRIMD
jgi:2-amino-4-hydroxy-6-hydroxymethyldihydropteridine diphosphokinase